MKPTPVAQPSEDQAPATPPAAAQPSTRNGGRGTPVPKPEPAKGEHEGATESQVAETPAPAGSAFKDETKAG